MDEQATATKAARLAAELEAVAGDGLLMPEAVVEYARVRPGSALHGEFEWDDAKAAAEHRVAQARGLIRAYVTVLPNTPVQVRAFVSVPTDRVNGGGYRRTNAVLKSDGFRQQMVEDVLKKLEGMKTSAAYLPELKGLFAELDVLIVTYRAGLVKQRDAA